MKWDPEQYAMFGDYRDRPFFDLTDRISATAPGKVVDLGCGPGNLTVTLANRWPRADVLGVDSSREMIVRAAAAHDTANVRFEQADARQWAATGADVVVSNALLQWVPGHDQLLTRWLGELESGAWFALQVPGNFDAPSHAIMRDLAASPRWSEQLGAALRGGDAVGAPADYLQLMLDAGFSADAWETTYLQLLQGEDPVLDWVRGTGLRPVLEVLNNHDARRFETEYASELREAYPPGDHGTVFPFRRIFCVGRKR
ncbi:class I SAM-dependent methyltransferase [Arthrobacter pigmenti]